MSTRSRKEERSKTEEQPQGLRCHLKGGGATRFLGVRHPSYWPKERNLTQKKDRSVLLKG